MGNGDIYGGLAVIFESLMVVFELVLEEGLEESCSYRSDTLGEVIIKKRRVEWHAVARAQVGRCYRLRILLPLQNSLQLTGSVA